MSAKDELKIKKDPGGFLLLGGLLAVTLLAAILGYGGCKDDLQSGNTFYEDVMGAYEDCNDAEIRFLTGKHGLQTAFGRCGSNNFGSFAWSPDGIHLYFQVTHAGHVLNGEDKSIFTVPTPKPVTNGAWLDEHRLLMLLPAEEARAEGQRVAVYDLRKNVLQAIGTDLKEPMHLHAPGPEGTAAYVTALDREGTRRPYRLEIATGEFERAFTWLDEPLEGFDVHLDAGLVTWSSGDAVHLARMNGEDRVVLQDATRAAVHRGGRYVILERLGEEVSLFDQTSWDAMDEDARARHERRRDAFAARLPDWTATTVRPPSLDLYDMERQRRYRITEFQGDAFQWYKPRDFFGSFRLWGVEQKELNKNVVLVDLTDRLRLLDRDQLPRGIELVGLDGQELEEGSEEG